MSIERALGFVVLSSFAGCCAGVFQGDAVRGLVSGALLANVTVIVLLKLGKQKD